MPIGAFLGGLIAHWFGLRAPFLVSAVVVGVCGLLMSRAVSTRTIADARAVAGENAE
jgi:MFS family permease